MTDLSNGVSQLLSVAFTGKTVETSVLMNQLLGLIQTIETQESRLLEKRADNLRRSQRTSEIVILAALLLGLVTALTAARVLSRSITRRVSDLLDGVGVVGHGMTVIPTDKSQDELGKLGLGLAHTSRLLNERQAEISDVSSRLQAVLRAASEVSILAEDKDGRITVFNAGSEKLLGYRAAEVMGKNLAMLFNPGSKIGNSLAMPRAIQTARESALRDIPLEQETSYVRKDLMSLDVQLSVTPLKNAAGQIVGLLHVAQDVTPRKVLERELRKKNAELKALSQVENRPEILGAALDKLSPFDNLYEHSSPLADAKPKILIVDDFEDTRFLLGVHLRELNCDMDFAADGEEALSKVAEQQYSLILITLVQNNF
ncbi:MAG: PAS domain S-box protein [Acidobacteriota bacterium]|nr:PAS domain S-box protein [Acidobacteriota bacterium]